MTCRLLKKPRTMQDATALRVCSAYVKPVDPGERDGRRTHGTGLQRDVKIATGQTRRPERVSGFPDRKNFGMRRWVGPGFRLVPGSGEDHAVGASDNKGADRHFAPIRGGAGLHQRLIHQCRGSGWLHPFRRVPEAPGVKPLRRTTDLSLGPLARR